MRLHTANRHRKIVARAALLRERRGVIFGKNRWTRRECRAWVREWRRLYPAWRDYFSGSDSHVKLPNLFPGTELRYK